jgi:cytochrome c oxidase subunit IV
MSKGTDRSKGQGRSNTGSTQKTTGSVHVAGGSAHITGGSAHAAVIGSTVGGTTKLFLYVWGWLLVLTGIETFLAYQQLNLNTMLFLLLGLSVIKAGLIIAYFMHLRFEKFSLFITLIPAVLFCMAMMGVLFPDSLRLLHLRPQ